MPDNSAVKPMHVPNVVHRVPVRRFNAACAAGALVWLTVTAPLGLRLRPTFHDFSQFYMAGAVARDGSWDALYPTPIPGLDTNPGLRDDGTAKPRYAQLARERDVEDFTRPITPPPTALVFLPLAWLNYPAAYYAWAVALALCAWGVALQAGRLYRMIAGERTHWEGVLCALIALSPMTARSIRITNVTPVVGLCLGWVVLAAVRGDRFRTGLAVVLGATLKYATLVLVPLLLVGRRWRTIAGTAAAAAALVGATLLIAGPGVFREFATSIAPTLNNRHSFQGNQSLGGMVDRIHLTAPKPPALVAATAAAMRVAQLAFLAAIGLLAIRRPRGDWSTPVAVAATAAALIAWLMIFAPISWEHYPIFLAPLAGWLLWEAAQSRRRFWIVMATGLFLNLPTSILHVPGFFTHRVFLPEPLNSTQLFAVIAVFGLALRRMGAGITAGSVGSAEPHLA